MRVRGVFSCVVAAGLTLALMPFGCGGALEESTVAYRPLGIGAVHESPNQRDGFEPPEATREKLKGCINLRAGQWSERSHAVQLDAKATDHGDMIEVKIRDTTMHDADVEECLRQAIAAMTIPEHALRSRSSRPLSGGAHMTRERRGPVGSSDSENPWILLGPFIVEAIGVNVLIEVGVGVVAAVGTIVGARKPKDCLEHYEACMDTPLGNRQVNIHGESLCATCRRTCQDDGGYWPTAVLVRRWESCKY